MLVLMKRRVFLATPLAAGALAPAATTKPLDPLFLTGDGLMFSPPEYAKLLGELAAKGSAERDTYCQGGAVVALEKRMAALLGKEAAMFFPTGTMANHVALRSLAGDNRRVLLPRESHTYNDEGDGPQLISGLNLVPLASGRATFTLEEAQAEIKHFEGGYRAVPVGAIAIESPVRRRFGETFDFEEMKRISAFARANKIGMHLDGARLLLAPPYSHIAPAQYAALFDTVYVSLYKYLGAPAGAVLSGPKKLLDAMVPVRHQLGGMVFAAWTSASIALHMLDGFEDRFARAVANSEEFLKHVAKDNRVSVERIPNGTNIAKLHLAAGVEGEALQKHLEAGGIRIRKPERGVLQVQANESLLRRPGAEVAEQFVKALG
jgi:threonine aldolase